MSENGTPDNGQVDPLKAIGERMKARRTQMGMSHGAVGKMVGCSRELIRLIEKGERPQSSSRLLAIQALGWSVENPLDILQEGTEPKMTAALAQHKSIIPITRDLEVKHAIAKMVQRLMMDQGLRHKALAECANAPASQIKQVLFGRAYLPDILKKTIQGLGIESGELSDLTLAYLSTAPESIVTKPDVINSNLTRYHADNIALLAQSSAILRTHYTITPEALLEHIPKAHPSTSVQILHHFEQQNSVGKRLTDRYIMSLLTAYANYDASEEIEKPLFQDEKKTPNLLKLAEKMNGLAADAPTPMTFEMAYLYNEAMKEIISIAKEIEPDLRKNQSEYTRLNSSNRPDYIGIYHPRCQATLEGIEAPQAGLGR